MLLIERYSLILMTFSDGGCHLSYLKPFLNLYLELSMSIVYILNYLEPVRCLLKKGFYRAMHFSAKRGIAIACRLSVRLSVRL